MPRVELRINSAELADTFDHMRMWLDHEDCVPVNFDQVGDVSGTIVLRVEFENDDLADAFQREFGSAVNDPTV
jgi:hypothetical protein